MKFTTLVVFLAFGFFSLKATAQTIPLEEFAALPKNSQVQLSPDSTKVLIITKYEGQKVVLVKPLTTATDFPGFAFPA